MGFELVNELILVLVVTLGLVVFTRLEATEVLALLAEVVVHVVAVIDEETELEVIDKSEVVVVIITGGIVVVTESV